MEQRKKRKDISGCVVDQVSEMSNNTDENDDEGETEERRKDDD